jgi:hypothetical protein
MRNLKKGAEGEKDKERLIVNGLTHTVSTKHLKMKFGSDSTDVLHAYKRVKLNED